MNINKDLRLCYIDGTRAWFTSDFDNQWGDDWNDSPYWCNAGDPYTENIVNNENKKVKLVKLVFETELQSNEDLGHYYSVEQLNAKCAAWLIPYYNFSKHLSEPIYAGVSIKDFIEIINKAGGVVYLSEEDHRALNGAK